MKPKTGAEAPCLETESVSSDNHGECIQIEDDSNVSPSDYGVTFSAPIEARVSMDASPTRLL